MKNAPGHSVAPASGGRDHLVWGIGLGALLIAVVTTLGALLIGPALGVGVRGPAGRSVALMFLGQMGIGPLDWLVCALSSPLFVWLARHFPINRQRWKTSLLLHFLAVNFNTLQGISTLMHRDVQAADAMLSGLSDLLRQTGLRVMRAAAT